MSNSQWSNDQETTVLFKRRVVVIGYGPAGSHFAVEAAKHKDLEVIVITPFEYMEVTICMTKVIAAGPDEHAKVIYDLLKEKNIQYITGTVTAMTDRQVTISSGRTIPFDVCVVATGQSYPIFCPDPAQPTMLQRKAAILEVHRQIRSAKSIVISGAGPVGVEAAADIKLRHKDKLVTIVSPNADVLSMMGAPFRSVAAGQLEQMGIHVIHGDRVVRHEDGQVTLLSGQSIACDFYIPAHCIGGNAGFLPVGSCDAKGYALVNDCFQVQGMDRVFAVGDCCSHDRAKTFIKVNDQMPTLVRNVVSFLASKPLVQHGRGSLLYGGINGPVIVALGHGVSGSYGIGPEVPGLLGTLLWLVFCGTPRGRLIAWIKTWFNMTFKPRPGKGLSN